MSNDTQPEIRFPGFTEDWELRKLGEILVLLKDGTHGTHKDVDEGMYLLSAKNIKNGKINIDESDRIISEDEYKSIHKNFNLEKGDVLLTIVGSIGEAAVLENPFKLTFQRSVAYLRPNGTLTSQFLYTTIMSTKFQRELKKRQVVSAQPGIYLGDLSMIPIELPCMEEQQKIGTFFKQLDDTITLHQRKLDLLKETKKGFLQKMFPKNGAKVPEIRFPGFTEDWEQRKVGEIFKVTRGQVLAATETSESITEKNIYPVYSSQTKNDGLMGYYSDYLFDTAITWTTDGANAGTVNYRNGKFYSTNVNGVLLSDKGYANKAVAEIINRIAWKHVSKVGNPKLMNNVMSEIIITIPSVEEQETISRFFTQLDSTITLHERELDLLKEMKKGFLQKMFV
ncbi:restriction endonuclease subunit S [Enterococcus faecium]|uniref:restriction endonuclease subunit S n=1 Tax=Enterococcus faecium TaxID=1352 RepID=UPI00100FFEA8|nr:restriction endonuclease subunit S [Enterococcus faecium]RXW53320.1 restriction endonuclease subunit S [Enterococcus faecium]